MYPQHSTKSSIGRGCSVWFNCVCCVFVWRVNREIKVVFHNDNFSATQHCIIVETLFRMAATLFQYCNAVLRQTSSLRIVPCNITFKQLRRRRRQRQLQKTIGLMIKKKLCTCSTFFSTFL